MAGGWTGKKKISESYEHYSKLKIHRSFDQGYDRALYQNPNLNQGAQNNSFDQSQNEN